VTSSVFLPPAIYFNLLLVLLSFIYPLVFPLSLLFPLDSLSLPGNSYPHSVTTAHPHTIVAPLDGAVGILKIRLLCVKTELYSLTNQLHVY
jgi:hypothetical protein